MSSPHIVVAHPSHPVVRGGAEEHILALFHGLDRHTFRPMAFRFIGFQRDIRPSLALADLAVLASRLAGRPPVATESLAAGKPVVATSVNGTPEVVLGTTGVLVAPAERGPLASAVCHPFLDPEERARVGRAGRAQVREHFTERLQIRSTEQLNRSELNERGVTVADRVDHRRSALPAQAEGVGR